MPDFSPPKDKCFRGKIKIWKQPNFPSCQKEKKFKIFFCYVFIMHFKFFFVKCFVCLCIYVCFLIFFLDWSFFFPTFFLCVHLHYFLVLIFNIFYFSSDKVLPITSLTTPPFQKLCGNCHVVDVIIRSTTDVHCNVCNSKSNVHICFFHGSIATIEGKWHDEILRMTKFEFLDLLIQNKFNFPFQFTFMVNFNCCPHLPLVVFKKT